jgi:hypothetical protein
VIDPFYPCHGRFEQRHVPDIALDVLDMRREAIAVRAGQSPNGILSKQKSIHEVAAQKARRSSDEDGHMSSPRGDPTIGRAFIP